MNRRDAVLPLRWLATRALAVAVAAGLILNGALLTPAAAQCLPIGCKFSESGKKGRYIDTDVDPAKLAGADAAIATGQANGRLLGAQAINRGEFAGTGLDMPKTAQALEVMIGRIAKNWTYRPVRPIRVRITGSSAYVPAAYPDGVVVVPMGVLMRSQSDDEVVWLLAHEFSHLALGHFAREAKASHASNAVDKVVMALQVGTDVSQQRVVKSGGRISLHTVQDKDAQRLSDSIWAKGDILIRAIAAINQFFSRKQEDQADAAGLDLAMAAGYSSAGATNAMLIIQNDEERAAKLRKSLGASLAAYTKASGAEAVQQALRGSDLNANGKGFLDGMLRNGVQIGLNYIEGAASQSHRPAQKRLSGIKDYYKNAHKKTAAGDEHFDWIEGIQATPEFKEAAKAVQARDNALGILDEGADTAPQAAAAALQPALTTRFVNTPLIANVRARIQERLGDLAGADRTYSLAEKLPGRSVQAVPVAKAGKRGKGGKPVEKLTGRGEAAMTVTKDPLVEQPLEGFADHVDMLIRKGDMARALFVIDVAKKRFGDVETFLPALIAIYFKSRQLDLFADAMARCMDTESPPLLQKCQAAWLDDNVQDKIDTLSPADQAKVDAALRHTAATTRRAGFWKSVGDQISGGED